MSHSPSDFTWAVPIMRAGYAGRGLTYLVIAGFSLWAIWQGGSAQGTSSALGQLEGSAWGAAVLVLIALGLAAYAVWRVVDAIWDLEDYGTDAKGLLARAGQIVTGLIHLAIGIAAAAILITSADGGGGSAISTAVGRLMSMPFGIWAVGVVGIITLGAGLYYGRKALREDYRDDLQANHFTLHWNPALRAGVLAQGIVVTVIGVFILIAALSADPGQAGGLGQTFTWLSQQVFGKVLVTLLCLGLLGFSLFCFVNAAYRIVPKAADEGMVSLAKRLQMG